MSAGLGAAGLPPGFTETRVVKGLISPTAMEFAPDGRLFICEQMGQLRVIKNGALLPAPFLSLSVDSDGERGLLGIAFDPNFAANQFVYVYYTVNLTPRRNRVSRFVASGDTAVPGSETVILELDVLSTALNHNGGAIHFGPDGKLYVGVGENGNPPNSQTTSNLLGKLLRINSDGTSPADNPFFLSASGPNRAIWALGLRNPFTFAFQPGTGRMFINDVGQDSEEEINDGIPGSNYGWPETEGYTTDPRFRSPLLAYGHGTSFTTGCAIAGGAFYNPTVQQFPAGFVGSYFFADLCGGWIRRYDIASNQSDLFAIGISFPVDLRVAADGSLYYLARGLGEVTRISYSAGYRNPKVAFRDQNSGIGANAYASFVVQNAGGLFSSDPSAAQDASGNTFVTARDASGSVWANVLDATTQLWDTWSPGGAITQGVPAIAVATDGTAYIAARDLSNSYWMTTYRRNTGFAGWTYLAGIFGEDPAMAACPDGSLYVVGKDGFNALWSGRFIPGSGFQNWQPGGGIVKGKVSVTCGSDNAAYVAARDTSDSLWMARVLGNTWTGWFLGAGIMSGDPKVAGYGADTAYAAIRDAVGVVWYRPFGVGAGNGWQAWINTGGILRDASAATVQGELFVAGRDANGDLWWYRSSSGEWSWVGNRDSAGVVAAAPQ